MTRIAYLDCASGASGDMFLGALVDLGLPLGTLEAEVRKVPLTGYRLEARHVRRASLAATKVDVVIEGHDSSGERGDNAHEHQHNRHRGLSDILSLLERGTLAPAVASRCATLFSRLAETEAAVHGVSANEVHFHEVGAVDSIVDIVGAVAGLEALGVERFVASPLNVGTGTVTMDHGTFAVPPPATNRLVRDVPVYGAGEGELLTPTGALLVTSYASSYGPLPAMTVRQSGYGAGTKDPPGRPNVLRIMVGDEIAGSSETVVVLETEIDDMNPQLFAPLFDRLFAAGALDAYFTPVQMKKGRPGVLVTVLTHPQHRSALEEVLFAETTTLGVRRQEWARTVLEREQVTVATRFGPIPVKLGRREGRLYNVQPEFDDCERAARQAGVPVKEVLAAALLACESIRTK